MRHVGDTRPRKTALASRKKQLGKVYSSPNPPASQVDVREDAKEIERWLDWGEAPWFAFRPAGEKGA